MEEYFIVLLIFIFRTAQIIPEIVRCLGNAQWMSVYSNCLLTPTSIKVILRIWRFCRHLDHSNEFFFNSPRALQKRSLSSLYPIWLASPVSGAVPEWNSDWQCLERSVSVNITVMLYYIDGSVVCWRSILKSRWSCGIVHSAVSADQPFSEEWKGIDTCWFDLHKKRRIYMHLQVHRQLTYIANWEIHFSSHQNPFRSMW